MDFQHNDNPFLLRSFNTDPFQVLLEHWSAILPEAEVGSQPTSEQAHHYEDRAIPDPSSMPPSYPYISHLMQVLPEPPHNFWVPQTPYSQQTVDLHPYDTVDVGHTSTTGICVEPIALEGNGVLVGPMRRRSGNLEKRRARKSRKSDLIDEIRTIVGLEHTASTLKVLNAVIQQFGGAVPRPTHRSKDEQMNLAYEWLHQYTGNQGRLRHVQCLELVIKALKGLPTLNPILVGQPGRRT